MESGTLFQCAEIKTKIMDKKLIIDKVLEQLSVCIEDMQSSDTNKAVKADQRFQALSLGLYNLIKAL